MPYQCTYLSGESWVPSSHQQGAQASRQPGQPDTQEAPGVGESTPGCCGVGRYHPAQLVQGLFLITRSQLVSVSHQAASQHTEVPASLVTKFNGQ